MRQESLARLTVDALIKFSRKSIFREKSSSFEIEEDKITVMKFEAENCITMESSGGDGEATPRDFSCIWNPRPSVHANECLFSR